jgi:hypothetical protein
MRAERSVRGQLRSGKGSRLEVRVEKGMEIALGGPQ